MGMGDSDVPLFFSHNSQPKTFTCSIVSNGKKSQLVIALSPGPTTGYNARLQLSLYLLPRSCGSSKSGVLGHLVLLDSEFGSSQPISSNCITFHWILATYHVSALFLVKITGKVFLQRAETLSGPLIFTYMRADAAPSMPV